VGRTLTLDNDIDVAVTGIVENNRLNSSVKYDFLLSMETARRLYGWTDDWAVNNQTPFVVSYFLMAMASVLLKQFLGWAHDPGFRRSLSVVYQTVKVSLSNPTNALRYE